MSHVRQGLPGPAAYDALLMKQQANAEASARNTRMVVLCIIVVLKHSQGDLEEPERWTVTTGFQTLKTPQSPISYRHHRTGPQLNVRVFFSWASPNCKKNHTQCALGISLHIIVYTGQTIGTMILVSRANVGAPKVYWPQLALAIYIHCVCVCVCVCLSVCLSVCAIHVWCIIPNPSKSDLMLIDNCLYKTIVSPVWACCKKIQNHQKNILLCRMPSYASAGPMSMGQTLVLAKSNCSHVL